MLGWERWLVVGSLGRIFLMRTWPFLRVSSRIIWYKASLCIVRLDIGFYSPHIRLIKVECLCIHISWIRSWTEKKLFFSFFDFWTLILSDLVIIQEVWQKKLMTFLMEFFFFLLTLLSINNKRNSSPMRQSVSFLICFEVGQLTSWEYLQIKSTDRKKR